MEQLRKVSIMCSYHFAVGKSYNDCTNVLVKNVIAEPIA